MWQEQKGSWYRWNGENLEASLIYHRGPVDGHPYARYGVQIHPREGGLIVIGYVKAIDFNEEKVQTIANNAIAEDQNYEWWIKNHIKWFTDKWPIS